MIDHCYCPSCAKRLPRRNKGSCRYCGYENSGPPYRLLTIQELVSAKRVLLNDVSSEFLWTVFRAGMEEARRNG